MLARWRAATDYPAGPNNAFAYCRFFRVGCRVRLTTSHGGTEPPLVIEGLMKATRRRTPGRSARPAAAWPSWWT
jgi:hypothetical protein